MKKILISIGALVILIVSAGLYLKIKGTDLIRDAIQIHGSEAIGAQIALDDISLSIIEGQAGLTNFTIDQPEGYGEDHSFSVENFNIDLKPLSLFEDHIKIESILIDKPMLNLVMHGKESNFTQLQENIASLSTDDTSSSDIRLSIGDLHLNQTELHINSDKYGEKTITLADIHLENIGLDSDGVAPEEAFRLVLDALKPQIAKALIELGIKDKLNEELDKQIGDKLKELPAPLVDKLKSGLGGLFKKKKKEEPPKEESL